ncbi:hypothetical protein AAMO2058_000618000 [Amorphochlora amoebiformis]
MRSVRHNRSLGPRTKPEDAARECSRHNQDTQPHKAKSKPKGPNKKDLPQTPVLQDLISGDSDDDIPKEILDKMELDTALNLHMGDPDQDPDLLSDPLTDAMSELAIDYKTHNAHIDTTYPLFTGQTPALVNSASSTLLNVHSTTNIALEQGNSSRLYGLHVGVQNVMQGSNYCKDTENIDPRVNRHRLRFDLRGSKFGSRLAVRDRSLGNEMANYGQIGIVSDSATIDLSFDTKKAIGIKFIGWEVKAVRYDSQAHLKGVRKGWRILSIDQTPVQNSTNHIKALFKSAFQRIYGEDKEALVTMSFDPLYNSGAYPVYHQVVPQTNTAANILVPGRRHDPAASNPNHNMRLRSRSQSRSQSQGPRAGRISRSRSISRGHSHVRMSNTSLSAVPSNHSVSGRRVSVTSEVSEAVSAYADSEILDMDMPRRKTFFKVVVVGNSRCGKTSIIKRLIHGHFNPKERSTVGADFHVKEITRGESVIKLRIFDLAGQDRFVTLTRAFYSKAEGVIIVCDISRSATLSAVEQWKSALDNSVRLEAKEKGLEVPIILIANKVDKLEGDTKSILFKGAEIQKLAHKTSIDAWFVGSAKDGRNICEAVEYLVTRMTEERQRASQRANMRHPRGKYRHGPSKRNRGGDGIIRLSARDFDSKAKSKNCCA